MVGRLFRDRRDAGRILADLLAPYRAVPAVAEPTCRELRSVVDNVVCSTTPSPFFAVGAAYWDFEQVTDDEVRRLLREAWSERPLTAVSEAAPEAVPFAASWHNYAASGARLRGSWSGRTIHTWATNAPRSAPTSVMARSRRPSPMRSDDN
jgi:hypothetical protein